ncbi:MAG: response regulator transcription factor [Chloroflexota bacterium]
MEPKVLVIEDDETLSEMLEYNLARQGYAVTVAKDGRSGVDLTRSIHPDLLVLDLMLPGLDGFEVCRMVRQEFNVPILMLTAKSEEIDRVVGLEMGADDYLTKPFSMRELLARVKALLRRVQMIRDEVQEAVPAPESSSPSMEQSNFVFDNLVINLNRREVTLNGRVLQLKPKEFELLTFLAKHRGIALSRDLILERVWGWTFDGNSRTVDVHVRWLREKIEVNPSSAERIMTVRGIGYRFEG